MNENKQFEGFEHEASELQKYLLTAGIFTISLKDSKIIHYSPDDSEAFKKWLEQNNVKNMREGN